MDFHHRYYKINKTLLSIVGMWPLHTLRTRVCIHIAIDLPTSLYVAAVLLATARSYSNGEPMTEHACNHDYLCIIFVKMMSDIWHTEKISRLINRIGQDWQVWADDREVIFLHRYADQGRTITIAYAVMLSLTAIIYGTAPVFYTLIDVWLKNGSEPGALPVPLDFYFFDVQKYYFYVVIYFWVMMCAGVLFQIAVDTMFYVFVQHCCGLFSALAHKLERITNNVRDAETRETIYESERKNSDLKTLISCVSRHNEAIQYADLIEATYTWSLFGVVALNTFLISIIGVQIITNINNLQFTVKFTIWAVTAMAILFFYTYMAQNLTDHSISIRDCIHKGKWYRLSLRAQKLLLFMSMRSSVPCKLTAGKVAILSAENFTALMKTCMSFFTFMNSM